jgi:hypothetical protein
VRMRRGLWMAAGLLALAAVPTTGAAQGARADCPLALAMPGGTPRDTLARPAGARAITLTGFLRDAEGKPLRAMVVALEWTERATMTAADGSYRIRVMEGEGDPAGRRRPMVRACAPGREYLTQIQEVQLHSPDGDIVIVSPDGTRSAPQDFTVRLDFVLHPMSIQF